MHGWAGPVRVVAQIGRQVALLSTKVILRDYLHVRPHIVSPQASDFSMPDDRDNCEPMNVISHVQ